MSAGRIEDLIEFWLDLLELGRRDWIAVLLGEGMHGGVIVSKHVVLDQGAVVAQKRDECIYAVDYGRKCLLEMHVGGFVFLDSSA